MDIDHEVISLSIEDPVHLFVIRIEEEEFVLFAGIDMPLEL